MTYEEATKRITDMRNEVIEFGYFNFGDGDIEALRLAIKAMELQVAKPVHWVGAHLDHVKGHCPSCGTKDSEQRGFETYCRECGQKLIWK